MQKILIVDDAQFFLTLLNKLLTGRGYNVTMAESGEEALHILETQRFDLMISDVNMSPLNGVELLQKVRASYVNMVVIMLTGLTTIDTAVNAMKKGAFDYITKPFKLDELLLTVQRALEYSAALAENEILKIRLDYWEHKDQPKAIVAESPAMARVCDMIRRIAPSDITVLLCGEKGCGKDLFARDIHCSSHRKSGPFLAFDCAAQPAAQQAVALFGQAKDSGLFGSARGGTLFLNGIGSLPLDVQSQLLGILQDKKVRRAGESTDVPVDVRIIAASNENLEHLVEKGLFRADLYKRLRAFRIDIPPLRDRREDILPLIDQTIRQKLNSGTDTLLLAREAKNIIDHYTWPGNVRELEEAIQYAMTAAENGVITKQALPPAIVAAVEGALSSSQISRRPEQHKGRAFRALLHSKEEEILERIARHQNRPKNPPPDGLTGSGTDRPEVQWL